MQTIHSRISLELGRDPTDAELETLAQTWSEHCSHKTLAGRDRLSGAGWPAAVREHAQGNDLRRHAATPPQLARARGRRLVRQRVRGQRRRGPVRRPISCRVQSRNAQPSVGARALRRREHGHRRRDSRSARHGPGRQADLQYRRVLLRSARHAGRHAAARRAASAAGDARALSPACAITATGWAFPRSTERFISIRAISAIRWCIAATSASCRATRSTRRPQPGDTIVVVGGRTGRDGIHGATFSSAELTSQSETLSGGAVQIGNAITEKMVLDVLLAARDRGLYRAITDCGAGGLSSAVGEMGEKIGAVVWLDRVPLKYQGLSYTEIWISEAQERMVLAVPPRALARAVGAVCSPKGSRRRAIGQFVPTGRLAIEIRRRGSRRSADGFLASRPAGKVVREAALHCRSRSRLAWPALAGAVATISRRICSKSSARSTSAARNGSSGNTITKCRGAAS